MREIFQGDCFDWLRERKPQSLQAVCTDPPYGLLEFTEKEVSKLRAGRGGVWRLPPTIGGSKRDPLPRFTILNETQKLELKKFFHEWGKLLMPQCFSGGASRSCQSRRAGCWSPPTSTDNFGMHG